MTVNQDQIIEELYSELRPIWKATEQALNEWQGEGNLQFPILLGMVAVRLNWDEKDVRKNDPFVRRYVHAHPEWHVTRGAKGGIMRIADKQKKEADKLAKEQTKQEMRAEIEAKAAAKAAQLASQPASSESSSDDQEDENDF